MEQSSISSITKKALIIAVSDYAGSSKLKSIEFCKNDGREMYKVLKKNEYEIPKDRKLIGYVTSDSLRNTIYNFFINENNKADDTLIFYYSGHGIPDRSGRIFLSSSDINSDHPFLKGYSFDDLTDTMLACNSLSVVTILDSCFSGALKLSKGLDSKGGEETTTRIANKRVEEKSNKLKNGVGRCLLASSQGYEEAYDRKEKDHSIFTYYLLKGLKGHKNALDDEGNVTFETLGKFIDREIKSLPSEKRPQQTPIRKGEISGGDIVIIPYPHLRKMNEDEYSQFMEIAGYYRLSPKVITDSKNDDIYYNNHNIILSAFSILNDYASLGNPNIQKSLSLLNTSIMTGLIYTNENMYTKIGYDGPQVPRYPNRQSHNHTLAWKKEE
jgi:hypothetical protein